MAVVYEAGAHIGRFVLEAEIGRGSTGVVYRAWDSVSQRPVAFKILAQHLTLDETARARFAREAAALARLKHPGIAQVYEYAALPECLYIATAWIEGQTLAAVLKDQQPLPLDRALKLFDQLGSALDYAHQHGVIHYDIKPANVMLDAADHAFIVDFELAWLSDAPASTNAGMLFGTPRYMAPEQIRGEKIDGRADLYSLAAVLFEMLTGQPPFVGESTPALLYHHLYTAPPPATEVNPSLPVSVETALLRALAKRPLNRFATAAELGRALHSNSASPLLAASPTRPRWLPAGLPGWLWAVVVGTVVVWLLIFLAFRAYRLTLIPVPTAIAPSTPRSALAMSVPSENIFPPPSPTWTAGANQLTLTPGTPRASGGLSLTPAEGVFIGSLPLTTGVSAVTVMPSFSSSVATGVATDSANAIATETPAATDTSQPTASATVLPAVPTPTPPVLATPSSTATRPTGTAVPVSTPTPVPTATDTPVVVNSATPTAGAPAAGGWWPATHGDARQSGFVSVGLPQLNSTPRWQVSAAGGQTFGLVAGQGLVVFSASGTDVRALDWASGTPIWNKSLGAQLAGELILDSPNGGPAMVVAPTTSGLVALYLQSGQSAWHNDSEGVQSAPLGGVTAGPDGTLYAITRNGVLYAVDAAGELRWSRQLTPPDEFALPPALSGSTLLVTSRSKVVRAFNLNTLTQTWSRALPDNLVTPPCVSETLGLIYVGSEAGNIYALRLNGGALAWSAPSSGGVAGLAADSAQVYATTTDGNVFAWQGGTGQLAWTASAGSPLQSPPLTDGANVLVATLGGQLRYLSTASGQEVNSRRLTFNDAFYQGLAPAGGWLFLRGTSLYGVSP